MAKQQRRRRPPQQRRRRPPQRSGRPRRDSQFRPDPKGVSVLKTLRLTQFQRMRLLKWGLYVLTIILALVLQDVIMSGVNFLGATTNLPVCVILMITVMEGVETGSLFVLIASVLYFYSGTAPFAYSIGLMCFFGIAACLLRQMYLHRSRASIALCAGAAAVCYELGLFAIGVFQHLTRWDRLGVFLLTGAIDVLTMLPLYSLIARISLIGGNTWKE